MLRKYQKKSSDCKLFVIQTLLNAFLLCCLQEKNVTFAHELRNKKIAMKFSEYIDTLKG